jgi:general secretion pathway protein I
MMRALQRVTGDMQSEISPFSHPAPFAPQGSHRNSHRALSGKRGFTLLEVMVALAILGVGFALAMELLAAGVRSAKTSEEYTQAVLLARQKIAEMAVTPSLRESAEQGDFGGGFRWSSEVQPLPQEEDLPARLYQMRVRVTWPGRRGWKSLDLYTMRMTVDEDKLGQTSPIQSGAGSGGRGQTLSGQGGMGGLGGGLFGR